VLWCQLFPLVQQLNTMGAAVKVAAVAAEVSSWMELTPRYVSAMGMVANDFAPVDACPFGRPFIIIITDASQ
jgi:hypothetical protein